MIVDSIGTTILRAKHIPRILHLPTGLACFLSPASTIIAVLTGFRKDLISIGGAFPAHLRESPDWYTCRKSLRLVISGCFGNREP